MPRRLLALVAGKFEVRHRLHVLTPPDRPQLDGAYRVGGENPGVDRVAYRGTVVPGGTGLSSRVQELVRLGQVRPSFGCVDRTCSASSPCHVRPLQPAVRAESRPGLSRPERYRSIPWGRVVAGGRKSPPPPPP